MSRTLKRPMFRKGGEVMEGIMTGIKPREKFEDKGMSNEMAKQLKNVQQRVNLIDAISGAGASPLANPLTQFLLQTGQNLIGGTAAGGTKLQELVGATRDPLNKAIAAQTRKDLSRRKIAASLLSKSNIDEARKAYNSYGKALYKTFEEFLPVYAKGQLERKPISDEDRERLEETNYIKGLRKVTDARNVPVVTEDEGKLIYKARKDALKNDFLKDKLDPRVQYVPKKAGIKKSTETIGGEERIVYRPNTGSTVDFVDGLAYFEPRLGKFLIYQEAQDILVPYGGYKL